MKKLKQGFILAGGQSSRFGTDKGTYVFEGKKFIENSVKVLAQFVEKITVLTNKPEKYSFLNLPTLQDKIKGIGPIGGLYTALSETESEWNLFLPCDSPFLTEKPITKLLENLDSQKQLIFPSTNDKVFPLTAIFNKNSVTKIEQQIKVQNYRIISLLEILDCKKVDCEEFKNEFANINSKEDLWEFQKKI